MFPRYSDEYYSPTLERMEPSELRRIQLKRLRRILTIAFEETRFYRRRFKELGFSPYDLDSLADFSKKLPPITKDDIRGEMQSGRDVTAGIFPRSGESGYSITVTSGTTGSNTFVAFTPESLNRLVDNQMLREIWMQKMRPGMKVMTPTEGWHFFALAQNIMLRKMRACVISPRGTHLNRFAECFVDTLLNLKPSYLLTVPSMLRAMIDRLEKTGVEATKAFRSVRYISLVGEPVSKSLRGQLLSRTGVTDIFERGGSADGLWGGGECYAHCGHHVWMDSNLIEVIDAKSGEVMPDGGRGVAVSTNLWGGHSLYIRFNTGDFVEQTFDECECGRTHHRVEIYDRVSNVVNVCGKEVSSIEVRSCLEEFEETASGNFTLVKSGESMDRLRVRASLDVATKDPDALADTIRARIRDNLGVDTSIDWVDFNQLPFVAGKLKRVVSQ